MHLRSFSARLAIVALVAHVALRPPLAAQERADPIAIGSARATVASSRGISSLFTNVGALALPALLNGEADEKVEVDLAITPIGIAAGSTYLNSSELDFVFDDKACDVFTDADRLRLGGLLERDRLAADVAADLAALRIRLPGIGAIGLQYGHRIRVRMNFPEEFRRDVLGTGDVFARSTNYEGADVGGEWVKRLALTLATSWERVDPIDSGDVWLPTVGFGASIATLEGIVHFDVDPESFVATQVLAPAGRTRRLGVEGYYAFRSAVPQNFEPSQAILRPGFGGADSSRALGWGGSLGVSAVVLRRVRLDEDHAFGTPLDPESLSRRRRVTRDAITVGFTVDEIGSLDWTGLNLRRHRTIDTVVTDARGGLSYEVLCGYRGELDTVGSFTSTLPTQFRIGGAIDVTAFVPSIRGDLLAGVEAAFDLNDAIGREGAPRVSVGGQWRPWRILTLYSGAQVGGHKGFAWSFGASVDPLEWLSIAAATSDWTAALRSGTLEYDVTFRLATHFTF
jgi:hypothetical protein